MELKKVALGVALILSLGGVGCGGDDTTGGGGGGPITGPNFTEPDCTGGAGAGDAVTYRLTGMTIPDHEAPPVPAFNFDNTTTNACGDNLDFDNGGDNALAYLGPQLAQLEPITGSTIQESVDANIADGTFVVEFTVTGYDGSGNDTCVQVALDSNYGMDTSGQGVVEDGVLSVKFDNEFGLGLPLSPEANANLDVFNGAAVFDIAAGTGTFGGIVNRGSTTDYCDAATAGCTAPAAEEALGTAHRGVWDGVVALNLAPSLEASATTIIEQILDMVSDVDAPEGNVDCGGLTAALDFSAEVAVP